MDQPWSTSPEDPVARHQHVVEEDLAELPGPVHRLDRPHGDAGAVHVDEQRGDPPVRGLRCPGARQQHAPLRVLGQARPDLLAVDPPAVTVAGRPAGERGQVAPRPRLGEALAPDLLAPEQARHHLCRQCLGRVVDHRRGQHLGHGVDARFDEVARREHLAEVGAQEVGAPQPADALGPTHAHEAGVVGQAHHLAQLRHLLVEGPDPLERGSELAGVLVQPVVDGRLECVQLHCARRQPAASADGAGRVGSCGFPESRAPLRRRKVMARVCSRHPCAVRW